MRLLKIFPLVDFKLCNLCRIIHVLHRANEKSVTLDCLIDVEGCKEYNNCYVGTSVCGKILIKLNLATWSL